MLGESDSRASVTMAIECRPRGRKPAFQAPYASPLASRRADDPRPRLSAALRSPAPPCFKRLGQPGYRGSNRAAAGSGSRFLRRRQRKPARDGEQGGLAPCAPAGALVADGWVPIFHRPDRTRNGIGRAGLQPQQMPGCRRPAAVAVNGSGCSDSSLWRDQRFRPDGRRRYR